MLPSNYEDFHAAADQLLIKMIYNSPTNGLNFANNVTLMQQVCNIVNNFASLNCFTLHSPTLEDDPFDNDEWGYEEIQHEYGNIWEKAAQKGCFIFPTSRYRNKQQLEEQRLTLHPEKFHYLRGSDARDRKNGLTVWKVYYTNTSIALAVNNVLFALSRFNPNCRGLSKKRNRFQLSFETMSQKAFRRTHDESPTGCSCGLDCASQHQRFPT